MSGVGRRANGDRPLGSTLWECTQVTNPVKDIGGSPRPVHAELSTERAEAVALYVAHDNLCRVHQTLRVTPAMALGIADHPWSIAELIEAAERAAGNETRACRQLSQMVVAARWTPARKLRAVLS